MVVGDAGTMFVTSDGGKSWVNNQSTLMKNLYAVYFSDADRGTIVGDMGTVLRAVPSGPTTDVRGDITNQLPAEFALFQNYPNPFNPTTAISYRLSAVSFVTLKVFDVLGREVAALVNEVRRPGVYTVRWNASTHPSGVFFYRLQTGKYSETRKMILMK
jgi:hypothetical protein